MHIKILLIKSYNNKNKYKDNIEIYNIIIKNKYKDNIEISYIIIKININKILKYFI